MAYIVIHSIAILIGYEDTIGYMDILMGDNGNGKSGRDDNYSS